MRMDLLQLLRDRPVVHPSRIVTTTQAGPEIRMHVVGYPWWDEQADKNVDHKLELVFGGVGDGVLEPCYGADFDEALDPFDVVPTADLVWAQSHGSAIYCSAPLPKPLEVYVLVHDFLASHGAFRPAVHYLNCPDNDLLNRFAQVTQARSYQLGKFPPAIRDVVCAELDAQKVPYTQLPVNLGKPGHFLVTIQRSQFFCDTAEAVI